MALCVGDAAGPPGNGVKAMINRETSGSKKSRAVVTNSDIWEIWTSIDPV